LEKLFKHTGIIALIELMPAKIIEARQAAVSRFIPSHLIFETIRSNYNKAFGEDIVKGFVISYQTAGDFVRFNPHFHSGFSYTT